MGGWVTAPGYRPDESMENYGARVKAAIGDALRAERPARRDPFADMDDGEAAAILARLSSAPARPAQLAHKPEKLETCTPCGGVINQQTGECQCSD
jgi:hypothetical protein